MKKIITVVMAILLLLSLGLTGCGGTEDVAGSEWPTDFSDVPEFTASTIENLLVVDETTTSMEFQNVSEEDLQAYSQELMDAGFTYEPENGNVFAKIVGEDSLAVGWNVFDSTIKLLLMRMPTGEDTGKIVVQWPEELDGITPFQRYTPNQAFMNPEGLVTVDYSGVTAEDLDAYRQAILADGFEPYELESGVEAYAMVDAAGTSYIVAINPQNDVEGHLQISGIITPAE